MKTIGERILAFDQLETTNVETFNNLFPEVPLTFFEETDSVVIGEITNKATTRLLLVGGVEIEHNFLRTLNSELEYLMEDSLC